MCLLDKVKVDYKIISQFLISFRVNKTEKMSCEKNLKSLLTIMFLISIINGCFCAQMTILNTKRKGMEGYCEYKGYEFKVGFERIMDPPLCKSYFCMSDYTLNEYT